MPAWGTWIGPLPFTTHAPLRPYTQTLATAAPTSSGSSGISQQSGNEWHTTSGRRAMSARLATCDERTRRQPLLSAATAGKVPAAGEGAG